MENNEIYENIGNMIKIQKEFQKERELFLERVENLTENDYISIGKLSAITSLMENNLNNDGKNEPINGYGPDGLYHVYLSMEAFTLLIENDPLVRDALLLEWEEYELNNINYTHFGIGKAFDYMNLKLIQVPSSQVKSGVNAKDIAYQSALVIGYGGSFDYLFTIFNFNKKIEWKVKNNGRSI